MTRFVGLLAGLGLAVSVAGCATTTPPSAGACPAGQEPRRLAQLFFGRNVGGQPGVSNEAFRKFLDEEITPRFPDGLTVLDGGGQWQGPENKLIREASKVVLIVMPRKGDRAKVDQVRDAYKRRFKQDSVLLVTQDTCVSF